MSIFLIIAHNVNISSAKVYLQRVRVDYLENLLPIAGKVTRVYYTSFIECLSGLSYKHMVVEGFEDTVKQSLE